MSGAAPLVIDELNLCDEMTERIDRCARHARAHLGADVSRQEVIHAAVTGWIEKAEREINATIWNITLAIRSDTPLFPYVQHWPREMADRLDTLAKRAGRALFCEVSRSAVVRAALTAWLCDAERRPVATAEAVHASIVAFALSGATPR